MSIKITDNNNTDKLLKILNEIRSKKVEIGIFGSTDSFMVMVAKVNEFGLNIEVSDKMRGWFAAQGYPLKKDTKEIKIPERSFFRGGFDANEAKISNYIKKEIWRALKGEWSVDKFYDKIGQYATGKMKEYLTDLRDPANSQMTIDLKGSSNPLIDNSKLRNSITYRVVNI